MVSQECMSALINMYIVANYRTDAIFVWYKCFEVDTNRPLVALEIWDSKQTEYPAKILYCRYDESLAWAVAIGD